MRMRLDERSKRLIRDNPHIKTCVLSRLTGASESLINSFRSYYICASDDKYDGCGIPSYDIIKHKAGLM